MQSRNIFSFFAVMVISCHGIAHADDEAAVPDTRSAESATAQSAARVYIDPKTGKLGGPPPGVQPPGLSIAVQQMLSRSDRGLVQSRLSNGTVVVDLQGRFQNVSVATIAPEGDAHINCDHSAERIEHVMEQGSGGAR